MAKYFSKKVLLSVLLFCIFLQQGFSDKTFFRLGGFRQAKIRAITHKGIQIVHSGGVCFITDANLSEQEQQILADELEVYRQKKAEYDKKVSAWKANVSKIQKAQTEELQAFYDKLPEMSISQIYRELKKKINITPHHPQFRQFFLKKYQFAGNKQETLEAILKKVSQFFTDEVRAIQNFCQNADIPQINQYMQKKLGVPYQDSDFAKRFNARYRLAENREDFLVFLNNKYQQYLTEQEAAREREKIQSSEKFFLQLTAEFEETQNNTYSSTDFEILAKRLIRHKEHAGIAKMYKSFSPAEKAFCDAVSLAGVFAESYFSELNFASRSTNLGMYRESDNHLANARKEKRKTQEYYENKALPAFENLKRQQMTLQQLADRKKAAYSEAELKKSPHSSFDDMNNSTIYFSSFSFSAIPLQLLDSANWRNPYYYSFGVFFLKQNGTTGIAVFFNTNIGNTPVTQITIKTESGELVPVNFSDTSVQETVNPFAGNIRNRENRSQVFIPANDYQRYFIHTMPEKIRFTINGQIIDEIIPPDMKAAFRQMAIFYQSPEFQR